MCYNQKSSSSKSFLTFDRKWDRCNDSVSIPILNQFKKLVDAKTLWIIRSREISRAVSSSKSSLEVQMNWLSTQVQSSPPSPSWTRGKKGTLNLSWKSVQLNFFWTFWTLYSSVNGWIPLQICDPNGASRQVWSLLGIGYYCFNPATRFRCSWQLPRGC